MSKDRDIIFEEDEEDLPLEFFDELGYPSIAGMHMVDRDMQLRPSKASIEKEALGFLDVPREGGHIGPKDSYEDSLSPIDMSSIVDLHPANESYVEDFETFKDTESDDLSTLSKVLDDLGYLKASKRIEAIRKFAIGPGAAVDRYMDRWIETKHNEDNPTQRIQRKGHLT